MKINHIMGQFRLRPAQAQDGRRHSRILVCLVILTLFGSVLSCNMLQLSPTPTPQPSPEPSLQPSSTSLLVGKWKNDATGEVLEFTETQMVLNIKEGKLYVNYTLVDENHYLADISGAQSVEFQVDENTLTLFDKDGKKTTYTRQ